MKTQGSDIAEADPLIDADAQIAGRHPKKSKRGRKPSGKLSRRRVISCALSIARRDGSQAVTMRKIASEAGVGTMSLYRYIEDRDDLLNGMLHVAFDKVSLPNSDDPVEDLLGIFKVIYGVFRAEPWIVTVMVDYAGGNRHVLPIFERIAVALKRLNMNDDEAFHTLHTLMHYTYGEALIMEAWARRVVGSGDHEFSRNDEKYPVISRMLAADIAAGEPEEEPYLSNLRRVLLWASDSSARR
ncbi:MAG: TetR/AcrR family transcriptional regulator [Pseudomonadota bacterium]